METPVKTKEEIADDSYFITRDALYNMEKFTYKGTDNSITYKYIISPCLDKLINYIPEWVAPNLITLFSMIINLVTFLIIVFEKGNDFNNPPSRWTCLLFSITNFTYYLLDNLDGKQARRTKSSSCFGMLFDHGVDAITCCLTSINIAHICSLGNSLKGFIVFICNCFGFWTVMYDEYINGFFNLGMLNGADEGNIVVCIISLISFLLGPSIWHIEVFSKYELIDISLALFIIGAIYTLISSFNSIIKNKGLLESLKLFSKDSILIFCIIIVFPVINYFLLGKLFHKYMDYIFYISIIMCSRIIIQIQIDIISQQPFVINAYTVIGCYSFIIAILIGNSIFHGFNYILNYVYLSMILILFTNLLFFIYNVINTILSFMGLSFLSIPSRPKAPTTEFQIITDTSTNK